MANISEKDYNETGFTSDSGNRYGGAKSKGQKDAYDAIHGTADYMDRKKAEALAEKKKQFEKDWMPDTSNEKWVETPEFAKFLDSHGLRGVGRKDWSFDDHVAEQDVYKEWVDNAKRTYNPNTSAAYDFSEYVDDDDKLRREIKDVTKRAPRTTEGAGAFQIGEDVGEDSSFKTELTRRPDSELESFKLAATRSGSVSFDDLINEGSTSVKGKSPEEAEATAMSTPEYKRVEQAKKNMDKANKAVWDNPTEENETKLRNAMKEWRESTSAYDSKMKEIGYDNYYDNPSGSIATSNEDWHGLEEVRDRVKAFANKAPKADIAPKADAPKADIAPKEDSKAKRLEEMLGEPTPKAEETEEILESGDEEEIESLTEEEIEMYLKDNPNTYHTEYAERVGRESREIAEILTNPEISLSGKYQGTTSRLKDIVKSLDGSDDKIVSAVEKTPIIGIIFKFGMMGINALRLLFQRLGLERDVGEKLESLYRARWPEENERGSYGKGYENGRGDIDLDSTVSRYDPNLGTGLGYNKGLKKDVQPSDEDCKKFIRTVVRGQPHVRNLANKIRGK